MPRFRVELCPISRNDDSVPPKRGRLGAARSLWLLLPVVLGGLLSLMSCGSHARPSAGYGIGRAVGDDSIASWNIDVAPNGAGLPAGHGTAQDGSQVYQSSCASCHGQAIALRRWAFPTSLFDYIRRAMPPERRETLTADELYAVTAFLLWTDGRIGPHDIVDRRVLPTIELSQAHTLRSP